MRHPPRLQIPRVRPNALELVDDIIRLCGIDKLVLGSHDDQSRGEIAVDDVHRVDGLGIRAILAAEPGVEGLGPHRSPGPDDPGVGPPEERILSAWVQPLSGFIIGV